MHTYTLLSRRLKSHQSIIVVLFRIDKRDVSGAGDPQAYTLRQTFSPPGKQPLLSHLRKPNTQVFLNDFKMILPFFFYVYFFYFLFFLLFVVYTTLLFYLFSRWLFFFLLLLYFVYLYLDVSIHRVNTCYGYTLQTPITVIIVHRVHLLYDCRQ